MGRPSLINIGTPASYLGVLDSNAMQSVPLGFNAELYIGVTQSILCTEWSGVVSAVMKNCGPAPIVIRCG